MPSPVVDTATTTFNAWSFCRNLLSRGGAISGDFKDRGYEAYSARLDAVARDAAKELDLAMKRLAELEGENERLRAALAPFADYAERNRNGPFGIGGYRSLPDDLALLEQANNGVTVSGLTLGHCRAALAALG